METASKQIQFFWQWFEKHQIELKNLSKPVEPFWDVVLNELKKVDSRLWIELSAPASVPREFIVTAEGKIEAFAIAEALVGSAPRIDGWEFVALKQAKGFDFTTAYEGVLFEPKDMCFSQRTVCLVPTR